MGPDPRGDVDRHAADVVADQLALPDMQADADLDPEVVSRGDDRLCAAQGGGGRPGEGRQEAVAGRLHLAAAEARELPANELVVPGEQVTPAPVPQLRGARSRVDDIGEHHGEQGSGGFPTPAHAGQALLDLADDRLDFAEEVERVPTRDLDVAGPRDAIGQIAGVPHVPDQLFVTVHDEGGDTDPRQVAPDVDVAGLA